MFSDWNLTFFTAIHGFAGGNRFLDWTGYFFANSLTYFLVLGMIVFIALRPRAGVRMLAAAEMLLAFLLGRWVVAYNIQYFFPSPRPFVKLGFEPLLHPNTVATFPSGHMAALFAVAAIVWYLDRRWGTWYLALSLLVGIGRIYAGVHWPVDIIAGIVIGLGSGFFVHALAGEYWEGMSTRNMEELAAE